MSRASDRIHCIGATSTRAVVRPVCRLPRAGDGRRPRRSNARRCSPRRARGQGAEEIYLGEELEEVAGPDRTGLHEVLTRVPGKPCAHEDIEHIVNGRFPLSRERTTGRQGARQIRVAAVVIICALEQPIV